MALMPDYLRLTVVEQAELDEIKRLAKIRHEKARKAAAKRGRKDFPLLPYECSAAYEQGFFRKVFALRPDTKYRRVETNGTPSHRLCLTGGL